MKLKRSILVLLLLVGTQAALARTPTLAQRIDAILADPEAARGFWGIEVISLDSGNRLYGQNADRLFVPASNTKLFTTAAALALIGPDYRFKTTVESNGTLDKYGRLTGDLVLVGRGDPNLSGRTLPFNLKTERKPPHIRALVDLADQLVAKGIKYVDGDVVADDSYFAFERYPYGWSQDDLVWEWGAPVSALTINDNVIFASILPADRPGERAFVSIEPFAGYYRVDNRIITTPPGTGPRKIYINREPGSRDLLLWGNIPLDDPGASDALAIENPAEFAAQLFRDLLEQRGVTVYGRTRTRHTELSNLSTFSVTALASGGGTHTAVGNQAFVLGSYESQPLADDLVVVNKVSQNLHAELLLRLLGRERGTAGTIEAGLEVQRGFLTQAGISPDEYVFFDGSGMSRQNLVSPRAITKLLAYAPLQPWGERFRDTLPVAGVDGTLAERLKGTSAQGRVRGKTGALGHVNSLSGYAQTLSGGQVAFAILCNNHKLSSKRAQELIDRIVLAIVEDQAPKKK